MHEESASTVLSPRAMLVRFAVLIGAALLVGIGGASTVLEAHQATACAVFVAIIFGTLFFWGFRLAIAFLGLAVLIFTNSLNIPQFVSSSSLEVILFLVGMMVIVGALRDLGFFTWIVQLIVSMPHLTGRKFTAVTAIASALLACAVDEVTSIIFVSTLIFQVCDRLKLNPTPYILIAVLATNVGSAGTMMGNPVGIYIGNKGGLTFGDFMIWSFPLMLVVLFATVALMLFCFRRQLREFDVRLKNRLEQGLSLAPVVDVPYKPGLLLITLTILAIASHHPLESFFGLAKKQCPVDYSADLRRRGDDSPPEPGALLHRAGGGLVDPPLLHASLRRGRDAGVHPCRPGDGEVLLRRLRHRNHRAGSLHLLRLRGRIGLHRQRDLRRRLLPGDRTALLQRQGSAALVGSAARRLLRRQHHDDRQHGEHRRARYAGEAFRRQHHLLLLAEDRTAFHGSRRCDRHRRAAAARTADAGSLCRGEV
ncbi:MAG: hypothetical protein L6W00_04520 [Lentisphaeria bacterium]|nr:MAG: hypothetical protein L6W00_04520 [Lentisphaeria bacterium]